jgi:hypothetical protein
MESEQIFLQMREKLREDGEVAFREYFARQILVGPFDDTGVAKPGEAHGEGFAIFIGEWRIGWWKTRKQACDEAQVLGEAIKHIPIYKH